jgi:hypothetical protein
MAKAEGEREALAEGVLGGTVEGNSIVEGAYVLAALVGGGVGTFVTSAPEGAGVFGEAKATLEGWSIRKQGGRK